MNYLWACLIVASILVAAFTGNIPHLGDAAISGAVSAATLCLNMIGVFALWMGIMNIAKQAGMMENLAKRMKRLLHFIFSGEKTEQAASLIALNLSANMLGMGNAATPAGVAAIAELNKTAKGNTASDDMCMLLIVNSSSVQLIPLTIIALRSAAGSASPSDIILPTFIVTMMTTVAGIFAAKLFAHISKMKNHG